MKIVIKREVYRETYTIGKLYIDNEFFCWTLEDKDRGLDSDMSLSEIKAIKVMHETAIPTGVYEVVINMVSPKFSAYPFYQEVCGGRLPRLLDVKGFDGILIHIGTNAEHSSGCILVGQNTIKGRLTNGKETFKKLYAMMAKAKDRGEKITLIIE